MVKNSSKYKTILKKSHRIINFLKRAKRIAWYKDQSCDVLIFDAEGSEMIFNCMPPKASFFVIKNRVETPLFLSIGFFSRLFFCLIEYRRPTVATISATIKYLKPKVIITYIDNSLTICLIKNLFPLMPVIAVQNGTRWDFSVKNKDRMEYDYYFSFGSVEADIFAQGGHTVSSFYPIGSLRVGIFRDECPVLKEKEFDLCFIPQIYAIPLNLAELDKWTLEMFTSYYEVSKRYFYIIAKYAEDNNLTLCVTMRSPQNSTDYASEREYFSYQGDVKIEYISQSRFSSYRAVQASRLSFTISSTLGYEALGWGERVIFAKDVEAVRALVTQGAWTDNLVTHRLPELQRLQSLDYSELSFKATELLKMTNENYINYSKSARAYYMNYDDEQKPHEIIKSKIKELLTTGHNNAL